MYCNHTFFMEYKGDTKTPVVVSDRLVHSAKVIGVNIEDLHTDLYHWFEKSTKRKGVLLEYMKFYRHEDTKILKHVSTRWLSLERCVQSTLEKHSGLKSYFLREEFAEVKFLFIFTVSPFIMF